MNSLEEGGKNQDENGQEALLVRSDHINFEGFTLTFNGHSQSI